jgi:hypothetical protein
MFQAATKYIDMIILWGMGSSDPASKSMGFCGDLDLSGLMRRNPTAMVLARLLQRK